ncbi:hypothetical protein [Micavibrio aeruginosavorus]|uniref:hypothetical protein n=1 Tax=Micavibrio aeruginosavorus TaxID=349221 RepID=UPI003F4AB8DF
MISDDALYVYDVGGKVRLVDTVPWATRDFEQTVSGLIRRECGGKAVMIVNDMTDQLFKGGQRIPKVGPMDKANVVARKLAVAFPNYPIRGALALKDAGPRKTGAAAAKVGGGLYLFAAVPMSEPVQKTIGAVKASMSSIAGFTLLPVESSDMVRVLAEKAAKREKTKSRWAVLIGQHQSGGLRQVITRDGQLAMTRMTPVTDLSTDPNAWVAEVAQEFKATISYLSRFGYSAGDGTDVFVITTPQAGEMLRQRIDVPCNMHNYTVGEAARELGFSIGIQENQYHADPLHASWIGRKSRLILPMVAADINKIYGPRQAATFAGLLLFCGAAYLGWQLADNAQAWFTAKDDLVSQQRLRINVNQEYEIEVARMNALGVDIKLIQSSLETYKTLEAESLRPLPILRKVGDALGAELRLDTMKIERVTPTLPDDPYAVAEMTPEQKAPTLKASLQLSFPGTVDPLVAKREVNDLQARLRAALPGYDVAIPRPVGDLVYEEVEGGTGMPGAQGSQAPLEDHVAELLITGPVQFHEPEVPDEVPAETPAEGTGTEGEAPADAPAQDNTAPDMTYEGAGQ